MRILNLGSLNIDKVYGVEHFVAAGETISCTTVVLNSDDLSWFGLEALRMDGLSVPHESCHCDVVDGFLDVACL